MVRTYLVPFLGLTILVTLTLLIGPRLPEPLVRPMMYRNVDLPGPLGLSLSVDSPEFMRLALQPSELLTPGQVRQSRPGLVLLAAPLAMSLATIVRPPVVASYLAYLMLHIATLVASFGLYLAIVRPPRDTFSLLVFLTGLLLLFNGVVTDFLLSPHTAMFNLLAPLLCLWIAERAWRHGLFHDRRVFAVALLAGLGFTSYGSFALALPALLLPAALREWTAGRLGVAFLGRAAAVTAIMLAPVGAWYALVVAVAGRFYSLETGMFRMFVWMADGLQSAGPQAVLHKLMMLFWLWLLHGAVMALPALAVVAATMLLVPTPGRTLWPRVRTDAGLAVFVWVLLGAFFALSGFVWKRNVYSSTVPFIALAGSCVAHAERLLPPRRLRLARWGLLVATVVLAAFVLLKDFAA